MFSLFQSLFSARSEAVGAWPEELVQEAIDRAVDGTDPRLRVLAGYRKRLREPVIRAVDHVVRLVNELPPPIAVNAASYREQACLRAMFASPERMLEVLARDQGLENARREGLCAEQPVTAMLSMRMSEKHTLGIDIEDEVLKRDVQQTVVSFDAHRLVDPCAEEALTRRALRRRAFDHILAQALDDMALRRSSRKELAGQRELLQRKRVALKRSGWSFDGARAPAAAPDEAALERELADIEAQLEALGPDEKTLEKHMEMLVAALVEPDRKLWSVERMLILDHRNVLRAKADSVARELSVRELHDARGARMVMLLVGIDLALLPRPDFFRAAKRYTG